MKKIILTSAVMAILSTTSYINANNSGMDDMYLKVGANAIIGGKTSKNPGTDNFANEFGETKFGAFGGVGFNLENIRAEILVSYLNGPEYKNTSNKTLETTGFVGFVNGYVETMELGTTKLSVGGGLGVSMLETVDTSADPTKTYADDFAFAWNIGAAITFDMSDDTAVEAGYSYNNYGKPGDSWAGDARNSHNMNLGLRFNL